MPPDSSSRGPAGLGPESLPPPCPARPASLPGSRRMWPPAPRPHPPPAPSAGASLPVPTQGRGGHPCFCTRRGKSPGHAETCGEPVTLKLVPTLPPPVTTGDRGRGAPSAGRPPPRPLGQAGRRARTHAGTHTSPGAAGFPAARSRGPGAGSRARAARRVRERAQPRVVRRAGARPSRTEKPARRRGGVWVSNAALPLWAAPGSVPPAASRRGGGCSCTRRGTDASSWGEGCFWSVGDVSQGPGGN